MHLNQSHIYYFVISLCLNTKYNVSPKQNFVSFCIVLVLLHFKRSRHFINARMTSLLFLDLMSLWVLIVRTSCISSDSHTIINSKLDRIICYHKHILGMRTLGKISTNLPISPPRGQQFILQFEMLKISYLVSIFQIRK